MAERWRHTGHLVSGEEKTVTFSWSHPIAVPNETDVEGRLAFIDTIRGLAALGMMRGLMTNFANTLRIERSEDDGQTWRTVYDERTY